MSGVSWKAKCYKESEWPYELQLIGSSNDFCRFSNVEAISNSDE